MTRRDLVVPCPDCDGNGYHWRQSQTGYSKDCDRCSGWGTLAWRDLTKAERREQHERRELDARAAARMREWVLADQERLRTSALAYARG